MADFNWLPSWLGMYPWVETLVALAVLGLVAWLANFITKRVVIRVLWKLLRSLPLGVKGDISQHGISSRLANVIPAVIVWMGINLVPGMPELALAIIRNVASAIIVLTLAMALSATLNLLNHIYENREENVNRPIKGYLQVLQIVVYAIAVILMVATLIDRSPLILLSGLGAMAAVLMLIFQDTLLSLVASVQISSNDILRPGDWLEMPQLNADGAVIDIALHTVKVQNWDKTITTIPTKRLITDSFKNWRGMQESGGRRLMRAINIDQNTIHFLTSEEVEKLRSFSLITDYLDEKTQELEAWNSGLDDSQKASVNMRRLTNIGTFRAYIDRYLRNHPGINQEMILMVRQLNPGSEGLPLQLYCFTSTVVWAEYETIQSDIFDHLFAIVPEFGLGVFQSPGGRDIRLLEDSFIRNGALTGLYPQT